MTIFDRVMILLSLITLAFWVVIGVGIFIAPKMGYVTGDYFIVLLTLTSIMSASLLIESVTRSRR